MKNSYQHAVDPAVRFAWDPCSDVVVVTVTLESKSMDEEQLRSYAESMVKAARNLHVGEGIPAASAPSGGP